MGTTRVDAQKVRQSGEDFLAEVVKMKSSLDKIKQLIDGSSAYFESDAGTALRKKFNESAQKFEEYKSFLNSYGEFLKTYSGNVDDFERAVEDVVGEIPIM